VAHLPRHVIEIGREALPLGRDGGACGVAVAFVEPGDLQRGLVHDARRIHWCEHRVVHTKSLHQGKIDDLSSRPDGVRREVEVIAEGAAERFVRAVAPVERHAQDVGSARGERSCRFAEAARPHVGHQVRAGGQAEGA